VAGVANIVTGMFFQYDLPSRSHVLFVIFMNAVRMRHMGVKSVRPCVSHGE